ncbi:MAG: hypothetical protein SYC29_00250 [Planctomycetota bacterium]|nr:hypothetical protein [Planctomycetota bacterium]
MRTQPTLNGPQVWSLLFIVAAGLVVILAVPPLLSALFSPGTDEAVVSTEFARLMDAHEEAVGTYEARFNGRSVFFAPPQPAPSRPEPPPRPEPIEPEEPELDTPVIPGSYTGPSIRALLGDTVWFHGGLRLTVGEQAEGLEVLAVDAPWSARVAYAGGEYDVSLFENLTPFFQDPDSGGGSTAPPGLIDAEGDAGDSVPPLRMSDDEGAGSSPARAAPKPPRRPPDVPPE